MFGSTSAARKRLLEADRHVLKLASLLRCQALNIQRQYRQGDTYVWTLVSQEEGPRPIGDLRDDLWALSRTLQALVTSVHARFGSSWPAAHTLRTIDNQVQTWLLRPSPPIGPLRQRFAGELQRDTATSCGVGLSGRVQRVRCACVICRLTPRSITITAHRTPGNLTNT
jgi:hypothetical protein